MMKKISKRVVFASREKLAKLLSLPEGVEIFAVRESAYDGSIEFLILSTEEISVDDFKVTIQSQEHHSAIRRVSVETLENLKNKKDTNNKYPTGGIVTSDALKPFTGIDQDRANELAKTIKKALDEKFKPKTTGLSFGDAINHLHKGKKVKRAIWGGYWVIEDNEEFGEIIVAYLKDGGKAVATPYNADMLALDWEVVE